MRPLTDTYRALIGNSTAATAAAAAERDETTVFVGELGRKQPVLGWLLIDELL